MATQPPTVNWPDRQEFLEWGLTECNATDCRVLINRAVRDSAYCTLCSRRFSRQKQRKARKASQ